jgi:NAD(P)-dependent dehydrogenase (short-subunit alcohol dehydrogenase family)
VIGEGSASKIAGMSEQTFALVTGANQGIGYEIAAGLGDSARSDGL